MDIACMYTIELVEYLLQVFLLHTQAGIRNREIQMLFIIPGLHRNVKRLVWLTVFHGIIHQIEDNILEMHLVNIESRIDGFDIGIDLSTCMLHAEREGIGNILNHLVQIEFFLLEHSLLAVEHTHLQYLFYQETKALRFIVDHVTQMFLHLFTLCHRSIIEHLRCQTDTGNRSLQFVGHIIDEVVLYLSISLLPEDNHNGKDEGNQQYQREDDTRNHEAHTREDIAVHIREMHPYYTHLRLWVVAEKHL